VRNKGGPITLIAFYNDDLQIASAHKTTLDAIKKALSMKFEMKDMGEARKCLGLEIFRFRKDELLSVSQSEYSKTVLARYNMAEIYGANTPMECGIDLHGTSELAKDVPYREAIGSLMYLMVGTRSDIANAMSQLPKFVESPTTPQWNAVKRVMRYIKQTLNHGSMLQIWWQV
jgi:hypothetical protein